MNFIDAPNIRAFDSSYAEDTMNIPNRLVVFTLASLPLLLASARAEHRAPAAQDKIVPPSAEYLARIRELAPAKATAVPAAPRKVLIFDLATGFKHDVIPHVNEVIGILGEKTGAFTSETTRDILRFTPESLAKVDAVVLNNSCTVGPRRNMFLDVLDKEPAFKDLTTEERAAKAAELEKSLLHFVAGGKGIVGVHGGLTFLNKSPEFTGMIGANFDFHPAKEILTLNPVEPDHPLLAAFGGEDFVHYDEPYVFGSPYADKNFRPLLKIDPAKLKPATAAKLKADVRYVSWIKPHGKGRVFYCGPSHQPESYETAALLRYYLDGIQYAIGDLKCDDAPRKE